MKNYLKILWAAALITCAAAGNAQETGTHAIGMNPIEPYEIQVTYDKTSHLIFPSAIRYVDLGSGCLTAGKAEDAQNVLRVKASVKGFETQTNFSVITEDGRFYSFDAHYSESPAVLSCSLSAMKKPADNPPLGDVLFDELGSSPPSLAALIMETIYKKDKRFVKHIGSKSFGIQFILKGIYIHNGKYYFHTELANRTNVPFDIEFMNFKAVDKKTARRTVIQEMPMLPLRSYKPLGIVGGKETQQNVFLLDQFTLDDGKVLLIELYEKNGGRHQTLQVENSDLIKARLVNEMHLKF